MKQLVLSASLMMLSFVVNAQTTQSSCMSRCEETLGAGNSNCPYMCQNYRENKPSSLLKKGEKSEVVAASISAASASSVVSLNAVAASKSQHVEKKEIVHAVASSPSLNSSSASKVQQTEKKDKSSSASSSQASQLK